MRAKQKPTRKSPVARAPSSTRLGRIELLLEEMKAQNRATIEAVYSVASELRREFNERFDRVEVRLDVLEAAVRKNSEDILLLRADVDGLKKEVADLRKDTNGLRKDVDGLRKDVDGLRKDVDALRKDVDALRVSVDALERRVAVVEVRLGIEQR